VSKIRALTARLEEPSVLQAASVDAIVCIDVLEHVFDPSATVESFARVSKRGAQVFLSVPSIFCGLEERLYAMTHGQLFPSMLHLNHFSEATLCDLFRQFHFRLVDLECFRLPEYSTVCGPEGDLVEILSILEPTLRSQDRRKFARHLVAVFEHLG
jgi:hypothetical protein